LKIKHEVIIGDLIKIQLNLIFFSGMLADVLEHIIREMESLQDVQTE
jgi:hypothetical protein